MAVAVEEKTSTEGAYSIYDSNEWDNEVIQQAIQEHQYHLSDRQKRYVGIKRLIGYIHCGCCVADFSNTVFVGCNYAKNQQSYRIRILPARPRRTSREGI